MPVAGVERAAQRLAAEIGAAALVRQHEAPAAEGLQLAADRDHVDRAGADRGDGAVLAGMGADAGDDAVMLEAQLPERPSCATAPAPRRPPCWRRQGRSRRSIAPAALPAGRPLSMAASDTLAMLAMASTGSVAMLDGPPVASPTRRPSASRTRARQLVPPPSMPRKYAAVTASPASPPGGGIMPIHYQYMTATISERQRIIR